MASFRENAIQLFNRIFQRNKSPMIANITKQNYDEYHRTYDTISKIFGKLEGIDAYLVGGISAAIQTNQDLYRQNEDIDIMCKEENLPLLIQTLQKQGYTVADKRGIKTENVVDYTGKFHPMDHELNADTRNKNMLGVGIFTYQVKGDEVITHSYAFEEKEGRVVGTEKVMPKELFDLMYDARSVDYKGMKLKSQSKEYIYLTKSRGSREKDKLDASVVEPHLDEKSQRKITRIKELESKTKTYRILYDEKGKVESRTKLPTLEERVSEYLDNLLMNDTTKIPDEIIADVLQSDMYHKIAESHPEIDNLIDSWRTKTKNYTYRDKVELLGKSYSRRLSDFSKAGINNALDFLAQRSRNHGNANNDVVLNDEAKEIFKLMQEYGEAIKQIFVDNNIDITHITEIAPEKLEGKVLRKSLNRANNYETEVVDGVFASSSPIDGKNPYMARNASGMIRFGESVYMYGDNNIEITEDSNGKKRAELRQPNYVYHMNPKGFTPVCNLTLSYHARRPMFEFSEEWISNEEIDISDPNQVRGIDELKDVTSLLYNYTVLCDVRKQGVALQARRQKGREETVKYIMSKIADGSVRNINHEVGINDRDLSGIDR